MNKEKHQTDIDFTKDFDSLLETDFFMQSKKFFAKGDYEEMQFYKSIYEKNWERLFGDKRDSRSIPPVIHFIWVGSKPFPSKSKDNIDSWIRHHPDWKVKFWTDQANALCPVECMEKHLIDELPMSHLGNFLRHTDNPAEKADLLRYEILYQEGGIYADHDIQCYQSFGRLTQRFDFYAVLEPPHYIPGYSYAIFPTNALIGCCPEHPILQKTMQHISQHWEPVGKQFAGKEKTFIRVLNRTFTAFAAGIKEDIFSGNYVNIILPASFLFDSQKIPREIVQKRIHNYCCLGNHMFDSTWY
jgi:mannosyltransferase OCH1-like enzyme